MIRHLTLFALLSAYPASAGVMLSAEVYDTPGLPGYQTFDLTASSPDGYLNTFGFYGGGQGISGPLHQGGVGNQLEVALGDKLYGDFASPASDSRWLVDPQRTIGVGVSQSSAGLFGAFTPQGFENRGQSQHLPFARLVTNDPSAVRLNGDFVVDNHWADGGAAGQTKHNVDLLLSDVMAGPPPVFGSLPERPAPPTPVVEPPTFNPPVYEHPVAEPPQPAAPSPLPYTGPSIVGPEDGLGLQLTASVVDTPGLPGFQTFDISVTSFDGYVNTFGFTDDGISGPLHHGGVDDSLTSLLADRLFDDGSGVLTDSRWLVDETMGLSIRAGQSDDGLHGAYSIYGNSGYRDTFRTLPLARLVTDDPEAVRITGEFVVNRYWDDGVEDGDLLYEVDTLLSDILVGDAPTDLGFPTRPEPPADPVVVQPPVEPIATDPVEPGPTPEPEGPTTEEPPAEPPVEESPVEESPPDEGEPLFVTYPICADCYQEVVLTPVEVVDIEGIIDAIWLRSTPTIDYVTTGLWRWPTDVWLEDYATDFVTPVAFDGVVLNTNSVRGFAFDGAHGQAAFAGLQQSTVPEPTALGMLLAALTACGAVTRR